MQGDNGLSTSCCGGSVGPFASSGVQSTLAESCACPAAPPTASSSGEGPDPRPHVGLAPLASEATNHGLASPRLALAHVGVAWLLGSQAIDDAWARAGLGKQQRGTSTALPPRQASSPSRTRPTGAGTERGLGALPAIVERPGASSLGLSRLTFDGAVARKATIALTTDTTTTPSRLSTRGAVQRQLRQDSAFIHQGLTIALPDGSASAPSPFAKREPLRARTPIGGRPPQGTVPPVPPKSGGGAPAPAPVPGMPKPGNVSVLVASPAVKECVLAGHGVPSSDDARIYGLDLGFSATSGGVSVFLFGDTWYSSGGDAISDDPVTGNTANSGLANNDAMAFVEDGAIVGCPRLEFLQWPGVDGGGLVYNPIAIRDAGGTIVQYLPNLGTPLAAFATFQYLYTIVFGPSEALVFARWSGFSQGQEPARFLAIDAITQDPIGPGAMLRPFVNVATASATSAELGGPLTLWKDESSVLMPGQLENAILVWGCKSFYPLAHSPNSPPDPSLKISDMRLFVLDADALDGGVVSPYYFSGFKLDGTTPTWTTAAQAAQVVAIGDVSSVNQTSVAYDPNLKLWVMVYGGRVPATSKGVSLGKDYAGAPIYVAVTDDVAEKTGIYLRWAKAPWGPWSKPVVVYRSYTANGVDCSTVFVPGALSASCVPSDTAPPIQGVAAAPIGAGAEYGAAIWRFEPLGGGASRVFFTMSTLNPYHVLMMSSVISWDNGE